MFKALRQAENICHKFCILTTIEHKITRHLHVQKHSEPKVEYNVGILGCGRIADVHLRNVLKSRRLNLRWIVENNLSRIHQVREKFNLGNGFQFFNSNHTKELLQDNSLDAVMVLSPTSTHAEYICDSLSKGKSVFSEKPAGECPADIKQCYETAEKVGLPFLTGYMRRFDPAFIDVKRAVNEGILGTIQGIKCTNRDSPKPSYDFLKSADNVACNILADQAVHDIDMMVWLTDARRPESIYVSCHVHDPELQDCQQPDCLAALIKYPCGILTTMDVFGESVYGYDIRLEVFGSRGMALAENPRESSTIIDGRSGGTTRRLFNSFPQRFEGSFEAELEHFVDCMDGNATPLVTKDQSLMVAEIIERGIQSFNTGQVVQF